MTKQTFTCFYPEDHFDDSSENRLRSDFNGSVSFLFLYKSAKTGKKVEVTEAVNNCRFSTEEDRQKYIAQKKKEGLNVVLEDGLFIKGGRIESDIRSEEVKLRGDSITFLGNGNLIFNLKK